MNKHKLIRITTVPISLDKLLDGQLRFMNQYFTVIGVSSDSDYLERIAKKEGIRVHNVEMTRAITPIKDIKSIISLYKFLKKENPKIIHSHTPKAGLVAMIAARLTNTPIRMHTVAGMPLIEATGFRKWLLFFVEKLTFYFAHLVLPNSKELERYIIDQNLCSKSKLKVLLNGSTNGINTSHFDASLFSISEKQSLKQSLKIEADDFVFIFVGRIVKDKGINELVVAFNKLSERNKKIKLLIVGPYEDELDPISSLSRDIINNNESIISVGYQNDVRPYFAISHVLVFPSYREGFPNVVMQAGSMGLPCIVSDINGCNEIIIPRENGLIIPAKDEEAIYDAMELLLNDKELLATLESNSRKMITNRYEQNIIWEALYNEYINLLKSKNIPINLNA